MHEERARCEFCGAVLTARAGPGRRRRYCSATCRSAARRQRSRLQGIVREPAARGASCEMRLLDRYCGRPAKYRLTDPAGTLDLCERCVELATEWLSTAQPREAALPVSPPQPRPPDRDGGSAVRFCLLGPVQLIVDRQSVPLGSPSLRSLLALLLLEANQFVPLHRIVDVLWAHEPPATARSAVQIYVSRLRRAIAAAKVDNVQLRTSRAGYRLDIDKSLIDVTLARSLLARARGLPAVRRVELLDEAHALWRGPALADIAERLPAPELHELWLAVLEARVDARLELGRNQEVISELIPLVEEQPFRERLVEQLILALYREGRRATALDMFAKVARRTAEELGIDPGPRLRDLQMRLLRDDPELHEPASYAVATPRVGVVAPAQLPPAPAGFAGREEDLEWLSQFLPPRDYAAIAVLTGPAGIGKTALATSWAHRAAAGFPDGQLFANMRGFDLEHEPARASDVLTRFLAALGVTDADVPVDLDQRAALYRSILANRRLMVVLDDVRDAQQVYPLLPTGSSSLVLVTSRIQLDGLVVRAGARMRMLDTLSIDAAERLIAHVAGDPVDAHDHELRRQLVRLCGYLPLALRIAAARLVGTPQWTVDYLVTELASVRQRLSSLELDETSSIRAALDLTYRSLLPEHAATVRYLGLYSGGRITPPVVAALCDIDEATARRYLRALAASHMVAAAGPDEFRMHDLVRLYARELAEAELSEVDRRAATQRLGATR